MADIVNIEVVYPDPVIVSVAITDAAMLSELSQEVARATAAEGDLADGLAAEASARASADAAEAAARAAGDATNAAAIASEATARAAADALLAPLDSAALTGTPTAPTAAPGTNTTQLANTAFVHAAIAALLDGAPGALDTLNELAAAMGADPNFATTVINALAGKQAASAVLDALAAGSDQSLGGIKTFLANIIGNGTANRLPNQAMATADAIATRELALRESLFSLGVCRAVIPNAFNTSGSGTASAAEGNLGWTLVGGTTANAWQRAGITRVATGNPGSSGAAPAGNAPFAVAIAGYFYLESVASTSEIRIVAGDAGSGAPPGIGSNAISGRGFGLRIYYSSANSRVEAKLFAHNGTTYVESTAIAFPVNVLVDALQTVVLATDGAGTIKLFYTSNTTSNGGGVRISHTAALTLAGGPTGNVLAGNYVSALLLNGASGPTAQPQHKGLNALIYNGVL